MRINRESEKHDFKLKSSGWNRFWIERNILGLSNGKFIAVQIAKRRPFLRTHFILSAIRKDSRKEFGGLLSTASFIALAVRNEDITTCSELMRFWLHTSRPRLLFCSDASRTHAFRIKRGICLKPIDIGREKCQGSYLIERYEEPRLRWSITHRNKCLHN